MKGKRETLEWSSGLATVDNHVSACISSSVAEQRGDVGVQRLHFWPCLNHDVRHDEFTLLNPSSCV